MYLPLLTSEILFPDVKYASPEGIVAMGGDLSSSRLLAAYRQGIFPWYSETDPILWWSPDPRGVIPLDDFHIGNTVKKIIRQKRFSVTFNADFDAVIHHCAERPNEKKSDGWITKEMITAYKNLHANGYAHSVEVWRNDKIVGGLYGIATGGLFAGESMFYKESNASKVALTALVERLNQQQFSLLDCQMITDVTKSMGGREISRHEYIQRLKQAVKQTCQFSISSL